MNKEYAILIAKAYIKSDGCQCGVTALPHVDMCNVCEHCFLYPPNICDTQERYCLEYWCNLANDSFPSVNVNKLMINTMTQKLYEAEFERDIEALLNE